MKYSSDFSTNNSKHLVAAQCLETAYGISLTNAQDQSKYDSTVDLVTLLSENLSTTPRTIDFTSWLGVAEHPVSFIVLHCRSTEGMHF